MYDLIIIGGGPAGLTSTIYAIRKRLNVLLISKDLGGKTNYRLALPWIEEHQVIKGVEVVKKFRNELEYLKFARQMKPVERVEKKGELFLVHTKDGEELQSKAVILATGAKQQRLTVPGEKEFIMRGLCYSALSYAPLFIDRKSVIVGDGELALRSTAELATVAKHVYLVGASGGILNTALGQKLKTTKNVSIMEGYQVVAVKGNGFADRLVMNTTDGNTIEIEADGIFIELGLIPNSQMVSSLVDLNKEGYIIVDKHGCTSLPGIFAAGDVTDTYAEQVLVAVGDGAKAALSAYDYLLLKL